ncbi:hypothetical protein Tco_1562134 [Tanacetum coccineum]
MEGLVTTFNNLAQMGQNLEIANDVARLCLVFSEASGFEPIDTQFGHALCRNDNIVVVLKQEIYANSTKLYKAPGPDGFTFGFYRRFWYLINNDVYEAVKYFFIHGDIPKGCNSSFIALIPKIPDANLVKDFRPISLIGSLYKIIAKILANRLVSVLGDIVNEVQSAFVADRQILDGPFILNEVMQ